MRLGDRIAGSLAGLLCCWLLPMAAGEAAPDSPNAREAHFRITSETVTGPLLPFSATIGGIGGSLIWDGGGSSRS